MNTGKAETGRLTETSRPSAVDWYSGQFETKLNQRGNWITRRWGHARGVADRIRDQSGIKRQFRSLQKEWLGDVTGKRAFDLGCGQGNNISVYLAEHADYYLALDLSEPAIQHLRANLDRRGLHAAHTVAGDFLEADFPYEPFDVVYANSIIHHFRPLENILIPLFERTTPGAKLVLMDPLGTSWPLRVTRTCIRPFRTDAGWNWPFQKADIETIQRYFEIERIQGFFGWSKWAVPLGIIPGMEPIATNLARRLHELDKQQADRVGEGLWRCNSLTMLLRRREAIAKA